MARLPCGMDVKHSTNLTEKDRQILGISYLPTFKKSKEGHLAGKTSSQDRIRDRWDRWHTQIQEYLQ